MALEPLAAQVTGTSENGAGLTIDRGSAQGVSPGMVVVAEPGLVGRVESVQDNASVIRTLVDGDFGIAYVVLESSGDSGPLYVDQEGALVVDLAPWTQAVAGEAVYTSLGSGAYPDGIRIGLLDDKRREKPVQGGNLTVITLDPCVNALTLDRVYVLLGTGQ